MRQIDHTNTETDKILHVRAVGCRVNVLVGTHDPDGFPYTTVEVIPDEPDDDGVEWACAGESTVIVRPRGRHIRLGGSSAATTQIPTEGGSTHG